MPNIKEYSASPTEKISIPTAGAQAWEIVGRHVGSVYARISADEREQGKAIAKLLDQYSLYEAPVEQKVGSSGGTKAKAETGGSVTTKGGGKNDLGFGKGIQDKSYAGTGLSDTASVGTGLASALVGKDKAATDADFKKRQFPDTGSKSLGVSYDRTTKKYTSTTESDTPGVGQDYSSDRELTSEENKTVAKRYGEGQPGFVLDKDTGNYVPNTASDAPASTWSDTLSRGAAAVSGWVGGILGGSTTDSTETSSGGEG